MYQVNVIQYFQKHQIILFLLEFSADNFSREKKQQKQGKMNLFETVIIGSFPT